MSMSQTVREVHFLCCVQPLGAGGGKLRFSALLCCVPAHSSVCVTSKTSAGRQMGCGDESV